MFIVSSRGPLLQMKIFHDILILQFRTAEKSLGYLSKINSVSELY